MNELSALKLAARLRVPLKDGVHADFVRKRFRSELPEPLPSGAQLFWGANCLGAFPLDHSPDPLDLMYPVIVEIGRTNLDDKTLLDLSPGAVFPLIKPYPSAFDILVGDRVIARAEALLKEDVFEAEVTEVLESPVPPLSNNPEIPNCITVVLGRSELTGRELEALAVHQVFPLDTRAAQPLLVEIDGRPFARVDVLIIDDAFHVRVRELLAVGPVAADAEAVFSSKQSNESIGASIEEAIEKTLVTIDSMDRPVDPALRREIEELFDEAPGSLPEPSPSPSSENKARATWIQLQLEQRKPRLAASLLAALSSEDAVTVLRLLGEADSGRLVVPLASGLLTPKEAQDQFADWKDRNRFVHRGIDDAKSLLGAAFGAAKAVDLINKATSRLGTEPFRALASISPSRLSALLGLEHPQTAAMVLAHLEPTQAAAVLENLEPLLQPDVVERIAHLRPINAGVRRDVERVLEKRLLGDLFGEKEPDPVGGIASAVLLLKEVTPVHHRFIIEALQEMEPELAAQLEARFLSPTFKMSDHPAGETVPDDDDPNF